MDKRAIAMQLVKANGYDPNSEDGERRVEAILTAADVCETYPQFTRAARYALETDFTRRSFTQKLVRGFQAARGSALAAAAVPAMSLLLDLADDGLLNLSHVTGAFGLIGLA